jgi:hypothetical protein
MTFKIFLSKLKHPLQHSVIEFVLEDAFTILNIIHILIEILKKNIEQYEPDLFMCLMALKLYRYPKYHNNYSVYNYFIDFYAFQLNHFI